MAIVMSRRALAVAGFFPRALARMAVAYALRRNHGCPVTTAWPVLRRKLERHGVWWDLNQSARVVCREGGLVLWDVAGERHWTPEASRVLPGLLEERSSGMYQDDRGPLAGDVVIDCGAHIGTFAAVAVARGAVRVIAIEPAPDNLECLRRNLAGPIAAGRVSVCPTGVWDSEDELVLRVIPHNPAADSVALDYPGSRPGPRVRVELIDGLVRHLGLERVDYMKIDVEGAEARALAGATETLRRWRPRLAVAVEHRDDDPERISALVREIVGDYYMDPGPWVLGRFSIRPQMLYFS